MSILRSHARSQPVFDFGMTDLEEQLAGQDGARIRIQVAEGLLARAQELLSLMDAGLSPEDFQNARCVYTALTTAYHVISIPLNQSKQIK